MTQAVFYIRKVPLSARCIWLCLIFAFCGTVAANSIQIGGSIGPSYYQRKTDIFFWDPNALTKPLYGIFTVFYASFGLPRHVYGNFSIEYSQKGGHGSKTYENPYADPITTDTFSIHQIIHALSVSTGPKLRFEYGSIHPYIGISARCDLITYTSGNIPSPITGKSTYFSQEPDFGFTMCGGVEIGKWKLRPFAQFVWQDKFDTEGTFIAITTGFSYSFR
jgi:hypothetical protein